MTEADPFRLPSSDVFIRTEVEGHRDTGHVWGEFTEARLNPTTLLREIVIYPGGRTSVHRHQHHSEVDVVVGGAVEVFVGIEPDHLERQVVQEGGFFHIPAGMFHAVGFLRSERRPDRLCARFVEVVYEFRSSEDIERFAPAVLGRRPEFGVTVLGRGPLREHP